tara:strand:- start:3697 stop:3957 length:261 start_codon:yes stop_codon:yes gene_type:complete
MRKLEQNFKYFIILLIILILGILIFGNYNLNLSLIESYTINTTKDSLTKQSDDADSFNNVCQETTKTTKSVFDVNATSFVNEKNVP